MNEKYDYMAAVKADVLAYIEDEIDLAEWRGRSEEFEKHLNEVLWGCDRVTGNASGSYFFSRWKAEEAICHNLDLLSDALADFGQDGTDVLRQGAEAADVTIRCYLLGWAISEALEELSEELEEEDEDNEN